MSHGSAVGGIAQVHTAQRDACVGLWDSNTLLPAAIQLPHCLPGPETAPKLCTQVSAGEVPQLQASKLMPTTCTSQHPHVYVWENFSRACSCLEASLTVSQALATVTRGVHKMCRAGMRVKGAASWKCLNCNLFQNNPCVKKIIQCLL